ncbi:hypothetical protein, partial [Escherichia coli]|uniref:hypothetical protein n=1 Tax=Escherichia coli TaxID=562 RepID=UPI001C572D27
RHTRQRSASSPLQLRVMPPSPDRRGRSPDRPSEDMGETAVERKRRLAVLAAQGEPERRHGSVDEADTGETPAERRRREAALG